MGERAARTAKCLWCGKEITAPDLGASDQLLYCGATHQSRASKFRQKNKGRECPRPDKRKYYTRTVARARLFGLVASGNAEPGTRFYECGEGKEGFGCGYWHLGNPRNKRLPKGQVPIEDVAERLAKRFKVTREKS